MNYTVTPARLNMRQGFALTLVLLLIAGITSGFGMFT